MSVIYWFVLKMQIIKKKWLLHGLLVDFCIEFVGDANAWWDKFYIHVLGRQMFEANGFSNDKKGHFSLCSKNVYEYM